MRFILLNICLVICSSCWYEDNNKPVAEILPTIHMVKDTVVKPRAEQLNLPPGSSYINTGTTKAVELLAFAKTLVGKPYKYASADPSAGFDCSGFLTYVFNHFKIAVPRSSVDFTEVERAIPLAEARPGDLVLFTGTDSTSRQVGHIGILTSTDKGEYYFIHATSGKAMGVTISALGKYYSFRFVKAIRIFPQHNL